MTRVLTLRSRFLGIPVWNIRDEENENRERLSILKDGKTIYEFLLPISKDSMAVTREPDFYDYLQIIGMTRNLFYPDYMTKADDNLKSGDEIMITGDLPDRFFELVTEVDILPYYEECLLHYHAPYGFASDPNGLIYDNGVWHVYHQHNPLGCGWANMSWGHAVTKDFIHYSFEGDVLFPDELGVMYSGSAIKNDKGFFGLARDAILYFYTCAGNAPYKGKKEPPFNYRRGKSVQRMAYSLDGGKTLLKYPGFELDLKGSENRDPKVFFFRENGVFIMIVYLEKNSFAILRSENLRDWEKTQELDLVPMWECPDLVEISDTSGNRRWALLSADGYYYMGKFDGFKFRFEGVMRGLYDDRTPYAGQTFSNVKGRTVAMSWLRVPNSGERFTGYLSLPRELSLDRDENGYYIRQSFARELDNFIEEDDDGWQVIRDINITERIDPTGKRLSVTVK
ncbi:MAG: glycoside hydrolase family 32 protein [Lachnospiraceae bacterium]|nr:glycoside hydrolase family 32 protein [Lachnospiraceae bacterium]